MKKVTVDGQVFTVKNITGYSDQTVAKYVKDFVKGAFDSPADVTAKENGTTIVVHESHAKNEKFKFIFQQ